MGPTTSNQIGKSKSLLLPNFRNSHISIPWLQRLWPRLTRIWILLSGTTRDSDLHPLRLNEWKTPLRSTQIWSHLQQGCTKAPLMRKSWTLDLGTNPLKSTGISDIKPNLMSKRSLTKWRTVTRWAVPKRASSSPITLLRATKKGWSWRRI
jgi:hypothetical protein